MKRVSVLFVALAMLLVAPAAMAEVKLALGKFEGKKADGFKKALVEGLLNSGEVALSPSARLVIHGKTKKKRKKWRATAILFDRKTGAEVARRVFKGGKKSKKLWNKVRSEFWDTMGSAITSAHNRLAAEAPKKKDPPPGKKEPAKKPVAKKPKKADKPKPKASAGTRAQSLSPLQVALGGRVFNRSFSYTDDLYGVMRDYSVDVGPMIAGEALWFPGAHVTDGAGAHIGLRFRGYGVIGVASETTSGESFGTTAFGLEGGLVGRIPIFDHEILLDVSAGHDVYEVETPSSGAALVPNIAYTWIRPGIGFRAVFGAGVSMSGDFGWLFVLDTGELGTDAWFPRLAAGGLSGSVFVNVDVFEGLEVQLGFEARRYWTEMLPEFGDKFIVGGVVDQYLMGTLRLAYRMP